MAEGVGVNEKRRGMEHEVELRRRHRNSTLRVKSSDQPIPSVYNTTRSNGTECLVCYAVIWTGINRLVHIT